MTFIFEVVIPIACVTVLFPAAVLIPVEAGVVAESSQSQATCVCIWVGSAGAYWGRAIYGRQLLCSAAAPALPCTLLPPLGRLGRLVHRIRLCTAP